jgi:uncharacterized cofD-like protein
MRRGQAQEFSQKRNRRINMGNKIKNIVVIGGGTGTFAVLSGLKKYPHNLTAIVSMADDGGSTGRLRDELGVLPPGDIRQCLVALSEADLLLRDLFNYRFDGGNLDGHSFGNLFISAFEKITGDLDKALEEVSNVLKIRGRVVPVTLNKVQLRAKLENGIELNGENEINNSWLLSKFGIKKLFLKPHAEANSKAIQAILDADAVVVGPGNLYCSIVPNFLVGDISEAIRKSKALKIYNCNLMTKYGHTDGFEVNNFVNTLEKYLGKEIFDYVIFGNKKPSGALLKKYSSEGEWVKSDGKALKDKRFIGADLVSSELYRQNQADELKRTLIRHDSDKLAKTIISLL